MIFRAIKFVIIPALLLLLLAAFLWIQTGAYHWQEETVHPLSAPAKRKVILLLVDSLLAESLEKLILRNEAPALAYLMKNGSYRRDMISSFPTMSVTIDSTLLTGAYADKHQVPGLLWFHPGEKRMIDYGDGLRIVWKPGVLQWFADSFYRLNEEHLSKQTSTLHEELAARGVTSGSINGLIFRGSRSHHFGLKGVYSLDVQGPDLLALGALSKVGGGAMPDGLFNAMGMNNEYTSKSLVRLVKENRLPDVTLAYFPDLDKELHKHGPASLEGVRKLDRQLQTILDAFGSWDDALQRTVFILMGDSGVTATLPDEKTALIDLESLLSGYHFYRLGQQQKAEDDVAFAVNGRMCYVYALSDRASLQQLADRLRQDQRIELIAWKEPEQDWIHVRKGEKIMSYKAGGRQLDRFGQSWEIRGDPSVLQLEVRKEDGRWDSSLYPDGLRRLESVFHSHAGRFLVITAQPGSEFSADGAPNHPNGGNHGSFDANDSLFPFLIATKGALPPLPERIVDLKAYLLSLLPL